jgi:hypothetical protein
MTTLITPQMDATISIPTLKPGDIVNVDAPRYHGTGIVSKETYYGSHIVWLDHKGLCIAVKIPNDNIWLYPANSVTLAKHQ